MTLRPLPLFVVSFALLGCEDPGPDHRWRAEIRWTSYGIPHITADDVPSALFGQGWAHAKDDGCIVLDQIVKVRSERARWFGPGEADANLDSDFAHLALGIYRNAEASFADQPAEVQEAIEAYAAGFNSYLRDFGDELPCDGEPWVAPVVPVDLFAHYIELGTLASGRQLSQYIATAQPPGAQLERDLPPVSSLADPRVGSNGWAIGAQRSAAGRGMLVANPHFPWEGDLKLWESHLRVEDEIDIYGVSLVGVLGVLIGFNEHVGWTHTVSDGQRFTFYSLTLDPTDATRYMYAGESRAMESTSYTIDVLQADGSVASASRTMWRSHYGPILNVPPFGWTNDLVMSYRDANADNDELIAQFLGMNRAKSLAEFQRVHEEVMGIPWVNTMATSAEGKAWYADTTPTPNLSQPAIDAWLERRETDFLTMALAQNDLVLLDGSDPLYEWVDEPGAREPGLVPYARVPKLERDDFVFNANDSHWLSNPLAPLEGFSPLHGFERTPRSPRTRTNALELTESGPSSLAGEDGLFDLAELQNAILSNRGIVAELLRDELVERCDGAAAVPTRTVEGEPVEVDLGPACAALASWDLRLDLDSVGALVFREFLGGYDYAQLFDAGVLFAEPFDPADPVGTPLGLAPAGDDGDPALVALADAVLRLEQAGFGPDTTLRAAQFTKKGDEHIAVHGGGRFEGVTNLVVYDVFKTTLAPPMPRGEVIDESTDLTSEGYVVNYGTSFIMTMRYTDDGPEAAAFLTYSQSDDPSSPHFADQTRRFSNKAWRPILYREDDIADDVKDERVVTGD